LKVSGSIDFNAAKVSRVWESRCGAENRQIKSDMMEPGRVVSSHDCDGDGVALRPCRDFRSDVSCFGGWSFSTRDLASK
jgi:hypothetical protein